MLDGFRLARFIEDDNAIDCFGPLYIAQLALRIILVFSETLFMTKNHRVGGKYANRTLCFQMKKKQHNFCPMALVLTH